MSCHKCGGPAPTSLCPCGEASTSAKTIRMDWAKDDVPTEIRWLMADFIPADALTILAGREGSGKSRLAGYLLASATVGSLRGDWLGIPQSALVVGTEDGWHSRWVARLRAGGANMARIARNPAFVTVDAHGNEVLDLVAISDPDNLELLAEAMTAEGISILYLDHLGEAIAEGTNYNSYGDMTTILKRLNAWGEASKITVIGGWHLSKGGGNIADKVIGSVGLRSSARCVLHVEEEPEQGLRIVAVTKCNDLEVGDTKAKSFTIVTTTLEWNGTIHEPAIATGLTDHDHPGSGKQYVQHLIDQAMNRDRPKDADGNPLAADAWLEDYFAANGPKVLKRTVIAWAEPAGYSESTIERAFARLGGQSSSSGGKAAMWSLPTSSRDTSGRLTESAESEEGDGIQPPQPPQPPHSASTASDLPNLPLLPGEEVGGSVRRDVPTATDDLTDQIEKRLQQ